MNLRQAQAFLDSKGFPNMDLLKIAGVYYLLGGDEDSRLPNQDVERCLHIVRQTELTPEVLTWKLEELGFKTVDQVCTSSK